MYDKLLQVSSQSYKIGYYSCVAPTFSSSEPAIHAQRKERKVFDVKVGEILEIIEVKEASDRVRGNVKTSSADAVWVTIHRFEDNFSFFCVTDAFARFIFKLFLLFVCSRSKENFSLFENREKSATRFKFGCTVVPDCTEFP